MSSVTGAVRDQLMANDKEFQRLEHEHANYAEQIEELTRKKYLSDQEQMEEVRLKKLKLKAKDQMEMLLHKAGNA
ncbi:MAG: DUF465 domain-containing protein [Terriglobia bacterium]